MKKFFIYSSFLFIFAILIYQERIAIAEYYANLFIVNDAKKGADAILVLNGNINTRLPQAVKLYKNKYAKQIWLIKPLETKTIYPHILKTKTKLKIDILRYEGIKNIFMLPDFKKDGVTSTFDEAYTLAVFLKSNPQFKNIIIVTDGFHTYRAKIAFEKILKKYKIKTQVQFSPAFSREFKIDKWFNYEKSLFTLFVSEPIKLLFYYFHTGNSTLYQNT